jgi:putative acetyltransferase
MLLPQVESGIEEVDKLMVAKDKSGELIGFMGIGNSKIEMLFISPEHFDKDIGTLLINYAINVLEANFVDVNEQNQQALGFYKHSGFEVYDRSETDEQGDPFPILHMKFTKSTSGK